MGTSLSGLTPATTFDGLLKTSDNDAIGTGLKPIGTGDGTDSVLQLSDSQLNVAGQFTIDSDTSVTAMNLRGDGLQINQIYQANETTYNSIAMANSAGIQFKNLGNIVAVIRENKFAVGLSTTPLATTHIKGSGATSATTSLLVENSNGADVLQTLDNGSVGIGTSANSSYRVTMTSGVLRLRDLLFGQTGSTAINNTNLLTMKWNGETGIGISGNGAIDATARLHIKGSGNDNTTTSLLVQNSDGTEHLKVTDDGGTILKSFGASNTLILDSSAGVSAFEMQSNNGSQRFRIQATSTTTRFTPNNTDGFNFVGNAIFTSGAFDTADARLQVKGSGATSATTALLVQNSAGTELMKVTDGGLAYIKSAVFTTSAQFRGFVDANNNSNLNFIVPSSGNSFVISKSYNPSNDASALLDVQSTTQGFLPPRMTTTERDAISTPAAGLMVYNTTTNKAQCYNGSTWNDLF